MEQGQVEQVRVWFDEYTSRFFGDDEVVDVHLRLKQEHTARTRAEIGLLAEALALDENQKRIAAVVALLHDVGRFPQFTEYRTFNDLKSVNHCELGVAVLREEGVLEGLPPQEAQWVETAVSCHGRKVIPSDVIGPALLFSKLIRDADKIDIFRVVLENYRGYRENPDTFLIEIELPDGPGYSRDVLEAVLNGELVDSRRLRTLNDMKLCQVGWVYDMNFTPALQRLKQLGFLDDIFECLPQTSEIAWARERILRYIDARLADAAK
ncbi:MAG: HD domain-containing protein [Sedimentisphaerales bacterium]|nr:HD domain-containing protein [Sedimentisphaerales bacterium]